MKKILSCMVFTVFLTILELSAEPLRLSTGGGTLLGYTFTRYSLEGDGALNPSSTGKIQSTQSMDRFNYGGFLFFDATYGEVAISLRGGANSYEETVDQKLTGGSWSGVSSDSGTGTEMTIGFSFLGKYPIRVSEKVRWFPLLGIEYQMALLEWRKSEGVVYDRTSGDLGADQDKNGNSYPLSAWNSLTIDVGAGFDYALKGHLFLRNELLFSFRLKTPYEAGALEMTKHRFHASDLSFFGLTGGPTLRTSVGYRLTDRD